MTDEEYKNIDIGDLLFNKKTSQVVRTQSRFSKDKEYKGDECLYSNECIPGLSENVFYKDCKEWFVVKSVNDLQGNTLAYCNMIWLKFDDLRKELSNTTLL